MSKKIALIQPITERGKSLGIMKAPESIQALAGQLEAAGQDVRMFHEREGEKLNKKLEEFNPDIVGISTMTQNFPDGRRIAEHIKTTKEDVLVVLGGWHVTGARTAYEKGDEEESLREILNPEAPFDYIMTGECDLSFPEMVRRIEQDESLEDLPGLGFLNEEDQIRLNINERIKNLNVLPDPSWKNLDVSIYHDKRSKDIDLSAHLQRGCRYSCSFCSSKTICGKGVRRFSVERSVNQLQNIIEEFNPPTITITDEDFFSNLQWVEKLVDLMKERGLHEKYKTCFDTFASMNDLIKLKRRGRADLLKKMKEVGFTSFTIGVEALTADALRDYNKPGMILELMTKEEREQFEESSREEQDRMLEEHHARNAQEAINFAQENDILICGDFMVGHPDETEEEVRANFEKFSNIKNLFIAYVPTFTPFPGTNLWKKAYDSGKLARNEDGSIDWTRYDSSKGVLDVGYDIGALRDELEVKFYTSERYHEDMLAIIKEQPKKIRLFLNRFKYTLEDFGPNELVEARLAELKELAEQLEQADQS